MKIDFQRSGGVAGMTLSLSIDTETLPAAEASELEELVERSDFFAMPEPADSPAGAADRFTYQLTIESADRKRALEVGDATAPEDLVPLLDRLAGMARRRAGG